MDEQPHYSNHGAVRRAVKPNGHRRAFAHDYREVGTYMVTMVTEGRARVVGHSEGTAKGKPGTAEAPHMVLSELGRRVLEEEVRKISCFYPQVEVWRVAMMPDHIHLLLRVREALPEGKHLGQVVRGFKTGCTRAWWALEDEKGLTGGGTGGQPSGKALGTAASEGAQGTMDTEGVSGTMVTEGVSGMATMQEKLSTTSTLMEGGVRKGGERAGVPEAFPSGNWRVGEGILQPGGKVLLQGQENNQQGEKVLQQGQEGDQQVATGQAHRPLLFSSGYHDRIINRPGMLENIKRYMLENPLRARIREECPRLMQRQLHLWIDGREYAAFGNLFLLKNPEKEQVFFHRYTAVDEKERRAILSSSHLTEKERQHIEKAPMKMPTHLTAAFREAYSRLLRMAEEGTVLVTPGISKGESFVVSAALEQQLPLIILQKEPIGRYWKPEQRRFYACASGRLLILSPWQLDEEIMQQRNTATFHLGESSQVVGDYARFHHLNDLASDICKAAEMRILNYGSLQG